LLVIVVHGGVETHRDSRKLSWILPEDFSRVRKLSLYAQPVFRFFQLSGCLVDGSNGGSSKVSGIANSSGGSIDMVRVSHNGGSNGLLDDGFSLDSNWDSNVVRGINMDGGWDLDDLLGVEGSIIGGINLALNKDWALDVVDFSLGLDNGGVDSLGSLEDSWDSDGKMGGGWLVDLGGVSGHIAGLAEVHLLGDHRGGLVDGGDSSTLCGCGVRSRGSWLSISYWGMGDNRASRVVLSSISNGSSSSSNWSNSSNWGSSSIAKTMDSSKTKSCIGASNGKISRGAIGTSHHKGKGHKRSHIARYLH